MITMMSNDIVARHRTVHILGTPDCPRELFARIFSCNSFFITAVILAGVLCSQVFVFVLVQ